MTDQQDTSETSETQTPTEAVDAAGEDDSGEAQSDEDAGEDKQGDEEGESDDDDDDDDDKKSKKSKKPKKVSIGYEAAMPRTEAVSYFEAIIGGLRSGRLEFKQDGQSLILSPPDQLEIEVKAQRKGDKAKVVFEIEWSDESRTLEILN